METKFVRETNLGGSIRQIFIDYLVVITNVTITSYFIIQFKHALKHTYGARLKAAGVSKDDSIPVVVNEDAKKKRDPGPEWRTQDRIPLGGNLRFQFLELETKL